MGQRIEIPLSKRKIILFLIGSIMFVVAGILGIIMPERFNSIYKSPEFIRITSILGVIFFGLSMVFTFKKLIGNNKFGLVIDEYGITDYSTATSIGLIEWSDIKAIEKINFASKNILVIYVNNPEMYINKASNAIAKHALRMNFKMTGSPITIIPYSLQNVKIDELEKMVISEFDKRKKLNTNS